MLFRRKRAGVGGNEGEAPLLLAPKCQALPPPPPPKKGLWSLWQPLGVGGDVRQRSQIQVESLARVQTSGLEVFTSA